MSATAEHVVSAEEVMAWVDGELGGVEARAVAAHVEACAECSAMAEEFRGASRMMAAWGVGEAPVGMEAVVMGEAANVAEEQKKRQPRGIIGGAVRSWKVWGVGLGGAVAAVLVFAMFVAARPRTAYKTFAKREEMTRLSEPADELRESDKLKTLAPPPVAAEAKRHAQLSQSDISNDKLTASASSQPSAVYGLLSQGRTGHEFDTAGAARKVADADLKAAVAPMIARTVSLTIAVKDLDAARGVLERVLLRHAGFASDVNATGTAGAGRTYNGTLKVPAGELAQAVSELKAIGKVQTETQTGEEVSEQHQDLEVRLKNARETEDRLRGILQQRTGTLSDVLEVEEEISRVRGEIEEMEGQQRGLEHRVAYATVTVELSEDATAAQPTAVARRLREAFADGFKNAGEMVVGLAVFVGENGLAFLFWMALLAVPARLVWRRYKRMQSKIGG